MKANTFFFRFTSDARADILRGHSFWAEVEPFEGSTHGEGSLGGYHVAKLSGLSGYELGANTLEEAIAEIQARDFAWADKNAENWAVFAGVLSKTQDTPEACTFIATAVAFVKGQEISEEIAENWPDDF